MSLNMLDAFDFTGAQFVTSWDAADPTVVDCNNNQGAPLLFPLPANEIGRLAAVRELNILDTA